MWVVHVVQVLCLATDVLWMSVVRGVRGVGRVCEMCLARGGVGGEGVSGREDWVWTIYCAWWIHVHLMCTQCAILLHLMDICFLQCICLWHISQIQTCLCVFVGPGFVSTSLAFMRTCASHPAVPHGRLAKKTVNRSPISGGGRFRRNLHSSL